MTDWPVYLLLTLLVLAFSPHALLLALFMIRSSHNDKRDRAYRLPDLSD